MPVAPEIAALLAEFNTRPPMREVPIAQLRQTRERIGATDVQAVGKVVDRVIAGPGGPLPLRLYAPEGATGSMPLVLFFHGGGFVFGSVDGYYDHVCRVLCARGRCRVISVAYRLAPDHKFPAAPDDCFAALQWAMSNAAELGIDSAKVFVAGGSAGASLAAVTALRARDSNGLALRGQILFYPLTAHHTPATASSLAYANGYYLTRADVIWFLQQYLRDDADARNPYALPLQSRSLSGLPPALVITAEFDPLRDEGEEYARRMRADRVPVTLTRYEGMIHGFLAFPTGAVERVFEETGRWIGTLAGSG